MTKFVRIENFKGFRRAELPDCRRVNVVVGENGSGKTALLEAIFFAAGTSAELALRTKAWRGYEVQQVSGSPRQIDEALWGDLFHEFRGRGEARVELSGGPPEHFRDLQIRFSDKSQVVVPIGRGKDESYNPIFDVPATPLTFRWRGPNKDSFESVATLEDGKLKISRAPDQAVDAVFFAANQPVNSGEMISRFSTLSRSFAVDRVVESFQKHFPTVHGMSIEVSAGTPMLFAAVAGQNRKIPLSLLSGGMNKLAALLFAIPNFAKGFVLIDEIESGFYFERFPRIWAAIHDFSVQYDVQLFVSTHSEECLRAAGSLAARFPKDFSLIRTSRDDGECRVKQFSGEKFSAAVESDVEIR